MQGVNNDNFGPLIAYLVPGATVLLGASPYSDTLQSWFTAGPAAAPTIGGFLYLTVASIAVGMTVSAVRWAIVDRLHSLTGLKPPLLDFSRLGENVSAFGLLIEIHYRHYQFYANMFIATAIAYICYRTSQESLFPLAWSDAGVLFLETVFFGTSRDTLTKYYLRCEQLLAANVDATMTHPTAADSFTSSCAVESAAPADRQKSPGPCRQLSESSAAE